MIAALPPSATGQPAECASRVSSNPNPAVSGVLSGSIECAATPARIAWPSSVPNRPASVAAGSRPGRPNLAIAIGLAGTERSGARTSGTMTSASRTSGDISRR